MLEDWVRIGDAAFDALHAVLVRPEQGAVERVDEAVAIRADDRHVAGGLDQRLLQVGAIGKFADRLAEAGGVADRAAGAARGELADDLDGQRPVDADEGGIRCGGQVGHRAVAPAPEHLVLASDGPARSRR